MKKYLNTLFVTTEGAYLSKENETVVVKIEGRAKLRLPIHNIGAIVCFGRVSLSPHLMDFCTRNGVSIVFLSPWGRFMAKVVGQTRGNVLLRRQQYRRADDRDFRVEASRSFVAGKIANSRTVLMRALRNHRGKIDEDAINRASQVLKHYLWALGNQRDLDGIRGIEGTAAGVYFEVFDKLIVAQKQDFYMRGRSRRPPRDNTNALLSFLYTLLRVDVQSALEVVGLDPYVGFLHSERPGRPSLALDLMEEFRPILADRVALSLINLQQVTRKHFKHTESGGVILNDEGRKKVIVAYQERKRDTIHHPFVDDTVEIGLLMHIQARLLARYIRGELDGYPPFVWR